MFQGDERKTPSESFFLISGHPSRSKPIDFFDESVQNDPGSFLIHPQKPLPEYLGRIEPSVSRHRGSGGRISDLSTGMIPVCMKGN